MHPGQHVAVGPRAGDDEGQSAETTDGRAVAAGAKSEEGPLLLLRQAMHRFPEPPDSIRALVVTVLVRSNLLQRVEVQLHGTADHQLQLVGAEKLPEQRVADTLVETSAESPVLAFHRRAEDPVAVLLHVLFSVLRGDGHVLPASLQFGLYLGAEAIVLDDEMQWSEHVFETRTWLVFQQCDQALRKRGLKIQQVRERQVDVHVTGPANAGVHSHREFDVEYHLVVNGETDDDPEELELEVGLKRVLVEPEVSRLVNLLEHAEVLVVQLFYQELEKFFLHAALVHTLFAVEDHLQLLLELLGTDLGQLLQRIFDHRSAADLQDQERIHGHAAAKHHLPSHRVAHFFTLHQDRLDAKHAHLGDWCEHEGKLYDAEVAPFLLGAGEILAARSL
mmetsp:Transcript_58280/g.162466  ORF Transcript_58280/g.162466 Transcript_58280/m.162466 type:complete len:391 (-) Transcript_58280:1143-2315(-)